MWKNDVGPYRDGLAGLVLLWPSQSVQVDKTLRQSGRKEWLAKLKRR